MLLDELTNGWIRIRSWIYGILIREIAGDLRILLSISIPSEVQAICNETKMIENGKLVFSGSMEDFDNYVAPESFVIEFGKAPDASTLETLCENKGVEALGNGRFRIYLKEDTGITEKYVEASVANDWDLRDLVVERCSLDEIFAQLSGKTKK